MSKRLRTILIAAGGILLIPIVGPFLIPVPPLEGTVPPQALADPDSRFVEIEGIQVHYKTYGQGEPTFVLLHGFAASVFSWREVVGPLSEMGTVIAFDRPAFGLTERPTRGDWQENPYTPEFQIKLTEGLLDALGVEEAILVGHSAGGGVATLFALERPERVSELILVDAAIYAGMKAPPLLHFVLNTPQARHVGPLISRAFRDRGLEFGQSAWHDPDKFTPEIWEGYTKPLRADNWDRALFEFTAASHPLGLAERLGELDLPALVITGDDDRIVPTAQSLQLAREIAGAELSVIADCGHVPQEECPAPFMDAVRTFLAAQ